MTVPGEERIEIRGSALPKDAKARCAMCGATRGLGKVSSPGLEYGIVLCPRHGEMWMDILVRSFTEGVMSLAEVLRDAGMC